MTARQLEQLKNARESRWRKAPTADERFWRKVDKSDASGCWIWNGYVEPGGYGVFWNKRFMKAHRYSWESMNGQVPKDRCLDHLCRNRKCVNIAHLEVVTQRTNILRGISVVAKQAKAIACSRGHLFNDENSRITPLGHRLCRICEKDRIQRYYQNNPGVKQKIDEWRRNYKKEQRSTNQ